MACTGKRHLHVNQRSFAFRDEMPDEQAPVLTIQSQREKVLVMWI